MRISKLNVVMTTAAAFALVACPNPAEKAPKAKVGAASAPAKAASAPAKAAASAPAKAATKTATSAAGGAVVKFSGDNSKVEFVGSKVTGNHPGGFKSFMGEITLDAKNVEASKVMVKIDMNSVYSDAEKLTGHLKSPDFFDTAKHPTSTFALTKIMKDGDKHKLAGTLTLRGQSKSIEFPAKITVSDAEVTAMAEFSINRKDFGIVYAGKADDLIRDDVLIKLNIKAPRK